MAEGWLFGIKNELLFNPMSASCQFQKSIFIFKLLILFNSMSNTPAVKLNVLFRSLERFFLSLYVLKQPFTPEYFVCDEGLTVSKVNGMEIEAIL